MNRTFLFCEILAYVDADYTETPTIESRFDLRVVCSSTIETSCTSRHASHGVWMFYRRSIAENDIQNMAKVVYNETECLATSRFTINCSCIDGNNVTCNISNVNIAQAGDKWHCRIFINERNLLSTLFSVPNEGNNECATTITEDITVKSYENVKDYVTGKSNAYTDIEETYNKTTSVTLFTQETMNKTMPYEMEQHGKESFNQNNNTTTSVKISTTYTINHTKTSEKEDSDNTHSFKFFSQREIFIIVAAVGAILVITASLCICGYWKLKGRSNVFTHQVTGIDNSRSTEPTRNISLEIIQDDTSLEHYHEIQDLTIFRDQVTEIDNIQSTEPTPRNSSLGIVKDESLALYHEIPEITSSYITVTNDQENPPDFTDHSDNTIHMHLACNTSIPEVAVHIRNDDAESLIERRISFMTIAEINTTNDAVKGSEIQRQVCIYTSKRQAKHFEK
ncbi:uncharacterized protein LOC127861806 [Dreissena polymorpha]|uniref:uncharacterized protein LOC127861806 n=1 Tax=Dreissena polymorpha TaxID=45954 RepID=UPI00226479B0|nr:uncharacterized protein LOC127861806 [Dreissena polymorpha]